jgi:hypothetical protein
VPQELCAQHMLARLFLCVTAFSACWRRASPSAAQRRS